MKLANPTFIFMTLMIIKAFNKQSIHSATYKIKENV